MNDKKIAAMQSKIATEKNEIAELLRQARDEALVEAAGGAKALGEKWWDDRISPNSEFHGSLHREGMADGAYDIYNAILDLPHDLAALEAYVQAKLAVAVEALEDALNRMEEDRTSGDCGNWDWVDGDVYSRGRAALAEIKGEK